MMKAYLSAKWRAFTEWAAWAAWNHARKRALRREKWLPGEAQDARQDMTPDQRRIRANEARQIVENRHFLGAWDALNAALDGQSLACDLHSPEGRERAARVAQSKQLLHGLRREFLRKLDDGYMAEVELDEIAKRNRVVRFQR